MCAAVDPYGLSGQVLDGQFRVDSPVGEGGFSVVYRGQHLGLDEPVAIKCLKLQQQLGSALVESFVRRFRDESKLHYKLSQGSLAIARTIAAGTSMAPATGALVPYMVLEWLDGYTLSEELRARRERGEHGRPMTEVLRFLSPVAEAMAFAHSLGVVHRDLNPSNIFVTVPLRGGSPKLKVMDFGVAKVLSDQALSLGPRAATLGQIRMFTPAYGAPEQFDDSIGSIGPWTDVYAFALMVIELLADQTPMEGENLGELMEQALRRDNRPSPRALGVEVGASIEAILACSISVNPKERPADMGEFWGELRNAFQRDEATQAREANKPPKASGKFLTASSPAPSGGPRTAKGTYILLDHAATQARISSNPYSVSQNPRISSIPDSSANPVEPPHALRTTLDMVDSITDSSMPSASAKQRNLRVDPLGPTEPGEMGTGASPPSRIVQPWEVPRIEGSLSESEETHQRSSTAGGPLQPPFVVDEVPTRASREHSSLGSTSAVSPSGSSAITLLLVVIGLLLAVIAIGVAFFIFVIRR